MGREFFARLKLADGTLPEYDRAYLVVSVSRATVGVLNVSTVSGKEQKLLYSSNRLLNKYFPPFPQRSFVKLDSLVYVSADELNNVHVLSGGNMLDGAELSSVLNDMKIFCR